MLLNGLLAVALLQPPTALPFVSPMFASHMVMQRDRANTIWGCSSPGARVSVHVGGRDASGAAGADGKWSVRINPPATGGPYDLTIDGPGQHVVLADVLVGDVWICSG